MLTMKEAEHADMKYFFFDFDGTLAVGKTCVIPEANIEVLNKLKEKGHSLAIATGRLQADAIQICKKLEIGNLVSDGGNGITIDWSLVDLVPLNRERSIELLQELDDKGFSWAVTVENACIRYTRSADFVNDVSDNYMETIIRPNIDYNEIPQFLKIYIGCRMDNEKDIDALKRLPVVRYSSRCLFIEPDDKSVGIKRVMDYLNAPYKDVVVFGDGTNDVKMFTGEWTSIAMGNAREELKSKADFITKNVDDNGIEYACRYFEWL